MAFGGIESGAGGKSCARQMLAGEDRNDPKRSVAGPLESVAIQIGPSTDRATSSNGCFGHLKENRRIVIRFDKLAKNYTAMVSLTSSMRCLRHLFTYKPKTLLAADSRND